MIKQQKENKNLKYYSTDVSSNLKYLLEIYSMSILELSKKSNIAYSAVYKLVNKSASPNLDTLIKISQVFSIHVSQLIGELPITTNTEKYLIKKTPIIKQENVVDFLNEKKFDLLATAPQIMTVSLDKNFNQKPFALITNTNIEPIFCKGSALIFCKTTLLPKYYNNKFVLVKINQCKIPVIKKLSAYKNNKIILKSVGSNKEHFLQDKDSILAYLIQIRMDIKFNDNQK